MRNDPRITCHHVPYWTGRVEDQVIKHLECASIYPFSKEELSFLKIKTFKLLLIELVFMDEKYTPKLFVFE